MADFALWATAAENTLGWPPNTVIKACNKNQTDSSTLPLEASPIVPGLRSLLRAEEKTFVGTATQLLRKLGFHSGNGTKRPTAWPTSPHALSCALRRIAPNLRAAGVHVSFVKSTGAGSRRMISIEDNGGYFSDATDASDANEDN
jgi:putative DNA primase/helicase